MIPSSPRCGGFSKIVEEKDCNESEKLVTLINTGIYSFKIDKLLMWWSIDDSNIIATDDEAERLLVEAINLATLCVSAEAVGCMTSCYLKTVQYTKEREQFDQPISNFQVLQHRMVDMFIDSELAKSLLYKAMLEVDSHSDDKFKHVSALKAHVGKFGKLSAQNAVQLHGGMGVSEEMMHRHYLKKMVAVDAMFGNADFHLKAFSK